MDEFLRKLRFFARRRQLEADLEEEMQFHAEQSGRKQFGNMTALKEEGRAAWTWTWVEQLGQDLRYAARSMGGNKAFTALAVLSLALGIGANTAIFSFLESVLLRKLPVRDAEQLVRVEFRAKDFPKIAHGFRGDGQRDETGYTSDSLPFPALTVLQSDPEVFSHVFAFDANGRFTTFVQGRAGFAWVVFATGDYFPGLGVVPAAGRLLTREDDDKAAAPVSVASYAYAEREFGEPHRAVGQTIRLNELPHTIVGVAPAHFSGADPAVQPDVYLPMHLLERTPPPMGKSQFEQTEFFWVQMMARLKPGVSIQQAQASLAPRFRNLMDAAARNDAERAVLPELFLRDGSMGRATRRDGYAKPLLVLMALVGLILALACANLANLLLARAAARRREIAVRLSMGASRWRVVRQLLTESVLLACAGGAAGVLLAMWGIRVLTAMLANGREGFTMHAELNWTVLAVTVALSVGAGIAMGLAPALQSTRIDAMPVLKETATVSVARHRGRMLPSLGQTLVIAQLAISLLLLVAAGLFTRTLYKLESRPLGFNPQNVLLFRISPSQAGYEGPRQVQLLREFDEQLRAIPGIRGVGSSTQALLAGETSTRTMKVEGVPEHLTNNIAYMGVGAGFFDTMQIPLRAGRYPSEFYTGGRPQVAVVNEQFARSFFPDSTPLGKRIQEPAMEIVGIVGDAQYASLHDDIRPLVYYPYGIASFGTIYQVRTQGDPLHYVNAVRETLRQLDNRIPLAEVRTQADQIDRIIGQEITFARLSVMFAALALVIACVGLYGTVSYNVARRTSEIGIRMALGAQRPRVIWMVLRDVFLACATGLIVGLPVAIAGSRLVESFLYGVQPADATALAGAVVTLLLAALAAAFSPARRASRIDPMSALRHE